MVQPEERTCSREKREKRGNRKRLVRCGGRRSASGPPQECSSLLRKEVVGAPLFSLDLTGEILLARESVAPVADSEASRYGDRVDYGITS